jgi:post-segregation antitoxin (ccd killing protein)
MRKRVAETASQSRSIHWKVTTDKVAKKLAQKYGVSVSKLLEALVLEEKRNPRLDNEEE